MRSLHNVSQNAALPNLVVLETAKQLKRQGSNWGLNLLSKLHSISLTPKPDLSSQGQTWT